MGRVWKADSSFLRGGGSLEWCAFISSKVIIIDLGCKPRRERRWCLAEWSKRSHRIIQRSVLYIANAHVGLSQSPHGRQRCQLLCIGLKRRCHLSFRQIPIKWSWQSFPLPSSNSNAEKEGQFEVSIFEEEGATILCSLLYQTIPRLTTTRSAEEAQTSALLPYY